MNKIFNTFLLLGMMLCAGAADRLAIAEPINKGGMKPEDIEAVWGMLEASVDGGYELISRSALKAMMTEIGLTTSSDLMNLNSSQKARLGEIKTVKYLLVPTVSKFGSRINLSLIMLDSSTGSIDPDKKASETFNSLDELSDKLKDTLAEIGLGTVAKKRGKSAILTPLIKSPHAPGYLAEEFNTLMEAALLNSGAKLQNLQSVTRILRKNNIDPLNEAEPAMFRRIGELLRVDYLVQASITRFSCIHQKVYIEVTRRYSVSSVGNIEGNVRIISAQTGDLVNSIPFRLKVDFADVDDKDDWTPRDYDKYLVDKVIPAVAGAVLKTISK